MSEIIVGIDLGTTNSEVALYRDGNVTIIEGESGPVLPSYVGIDSNGELLVGDAARNQYVVYPERTVKSIKRMMGEDVRITLGAENYSPQEISAIILKQLKNNAEKYHGAPVNRAVITVPAYFSDAQRQATREAGEIAGLEVVKIVNEPTAAALVYEAGNHGSKRVMVYDLGGGTFDVSVVQIEDDVIEVVASHGNNKLGGDDFDQKIVEHILKFLSTEHQITEIPARSMARIERAAEAAKMVLSDKPFAAIEEEYILEKEGVPFHLRMEISRHDYEELIASFIDETLEAVHIALRDTGLAASDIDEILLVGGSTRTPLVRRRLAEEFGMEPRGEMDPDLCVAAGASLQAAMLGGGEVRAVLVDVTPYTFGTSAIGEIDGEFSFDMYVPLIRKNTPIPVSKSEVFYTTHQGQEEVEVKVFQGEEKDARDNIEIGRFLVSGLSTLPSGGEIIATFSLDTDGMLHVSAMEKETGLEKSISIDNALSRFEEDELNQARNKVQKLFGESVVENSPAEKTGAAGGMKVQAEALVEKAKKMLDGADDDDREEMVDLIEEIDAALQAGKQELLREVMNELSEIIFFLES